LTLILASACGGNDAFDGRWSALREAARPAQTTEASIHQLMRLVDDPEPAWRRAADRALAQLAPTHAQTLVTLFCDVEDASPEYRAALRLALTRSGEAGAQALTQRLMNAGRSNPRELGIVLAAIGAPALTALRDSLCNRDPRCRAIAAWTLGEMGRPARPRLDELLQCAQSDEPLVAMRAIAALSRIAPEDPAVQGEFTRLAESADGVRAGAAKDALARGALLEARLPAAEMLRIHGARNWEPAVDAMKSPETPSGRLAAQLFTHALSEEFRALLGGESNASLLMRQMENDLAQTRALACLSLALISSDPVSRSAALRVALQDSHPAVVHCARVALQHMGEQP
jgi:hypothetical protein